MTSVALILGFIGISIGLIMSLTIYDAVDKSITCPPVETDPILNADCTNSKSMAWVILIILPISLFFILFNVFGGFSRATGDDEEDITEETQKLVSKYHALTTPNYKHGGINTHRRIQEHIEYKKPRMPKVSKFDAPDTDFMEVESYYD